MRLRLSLVLSLLPVTLLFGGCSSESGDDDDEGQSPTEAPSSPTPAPSPTPIPDSDGDGVTDDEDPDPTNASICGDEDLDTCDDCSSGTLDEAADGPDQDGDGYCDVGDSDADGDGVTVVNDCDDTDPLASPTFGYDRDGDGIDNDCDGQPDNSTAVASAKVYWEGASRNGALGMVAQGVGDLDGDDLPDWIVTEPYFGNNQGRVYVFYSAGARTIKNGNVESAADAYIEGEGDGAGAGRSIAVGDLDGDGLRDLAIGEPLYKKGTKNGHVAVFYGKSNQLKGSVRMETASFFIEGDSAELVVGSALEMTDIDDDGYDDLIIGVPTRDSNAGGIYIMFGTASKVSGTSDVSGIVTFIPGPVAGGLAGSSIAAIGDVDGDGNTDLAVGAPEADSPEAVFAVGAVQLIYGKPSRSDLKADQVLYGESDGERAGSMVAGVGRIDDSGELVVAVGAPMGTTSAEGDGIVYLIKPDRSSKSKSVVESADGTIVGDLTGGGVGERSTLAGVGDVDGDGTDDLLVSAYTASTSSLATAGVVSLFFGGVQLSGEVSFGLGEVAWEGELAQDRLGYVGGAGDIDQDGHADMLMAAPFHDVTGSENAGSTYLFFGY